jgi:iron complex transport system ATP-binding protein
MGMSILVTRDAALVVDDNFLCKGVSASFTSGELVAIVGPNGAGKSSLLALLAGDVTPSQGSVHLNDRPLADFSTVDLARSRAMLTQSNTVAFSFTVEEVVAMGRYPWQGTAESAKDEAVIKSVMTACEVAHLDTRRITKLSGGELARVALARVLAQSTPVILLDEPTAALDVKHQELVMEILRERVADGALAIVVMHDLEAAAAIASRIILMCDGEVVGDGPPVDVLSAAVLSDVYDHPIDVKVDEATGHLDIRPSRAPRQVRHRSSTARESPF